jgi:hypothetical protein
VSGVVPEVAQDDRQALGVGGDNYERPAGPQALLGARKQPQGVVDRKVLHQMGGKQSVGGLVGGLHKSESVLLDNVKSTRLCLGHHTRVGIDAQRSLTRVLQQFQELAPAASQLDYEVVSCQELQVVTPHLTDVVRVESLLPVVGALDGIGLTFYCPPPAVSVRDANSLEHHVPTDRQVNPYAACAGQAHLDSFYYRGDNRGSLVLRIVEAEYQPRSLQSFLREPLPEHYGGDSGFDGDEAQPPRWVDLGHDQLLLGVQRHESERSERAETLSKRLNGA